VRLGAITAVADDPGSLVTDVARPTHEVVWQRRRDLRSGLRETVEHWHEVANK